MADDNEESQKLLEAQDLFRQGQQLLAGKKFAEAFKMFQRAYQTFSEGTPGKEYALYWNYSKFRAYFERGDQGKSREALLELKDRVEAASDLEMAHVLLGYALQVAGKADDAIKSYENALKVNENCQEAMNALASTSRVQEKDNEEKKKRSKTRKLPQYNYQEHSRNTGKFITMGVTLIIGIAGIFYNADYWFSGTSQEELEASILEEIVPATRIVKSGETANVTLRSHWSRNVDRQVLNSKCKKSLDMLDAYMINFLMLQDDEKGLIAICTKGNVQTMK